jgi:hypothetical protein
MLPVCASTRNGGSDKRPRQVLRINLALAEQRHFRAIAYPSLQAENACAKEASWGESRSTSLTVPLKHQRPFTRGRLISAAFLFGQTHLG